MPTDVVAILAVFSTISFITWTIFSSVRRYKVARVQADVQTVLLARFDPAQNMAAYVETDAGKKFLSSLALEKEAPLAPTLECVRWGIIVIFLGGALCLLRGLHAIDPDAIVPGVLALALGVGFEVAAFTSWHLYRSLGLNEPRA
jgi:hypothetical protein